MTFQMLKSKVFFLHHYLDDFIFLREKQSVMRAQTMSDYEWLCSLLGVHLDEGPTVILVFLGLELDSVMSQIKIPIEKLKELRSALTSLLNKKRVTLKDLQ